MKRLSVLALLIAVMISMIVYLASCGGGGGGSDEQQAPPAAGGSGTGAGGIKVFWYPYDTNMAMGTGNSVEETSDHGFVVAGSQSSIQGPALPPLDIFLMKTDALGSAEWKKRFPWPGGAEAKAVRQTSDGGYIVTGQTNTQGYYHRVYMLKTDAGGNAAAGWPKTYGGAVDSAAYSVLEVANGYMVAGYTVGYVDANQQPHLNIYVIRTDSNGSVIWEKKDYPSFCPAGNEIARALMPTADGNFAVAGITGCNGFKSFLLKIDDQGNELWRNVYGTSTESMETAYSVATTTDGFVLAGSRAVVSGQTSTLPGTPGPYDVLVIKTDLNGSELWRRTYGGIDQDEAYSVAVTQQNEYLVFGYTQSYGGTVNPNYSWQYQDLFLIKLDSSGNTLWQKVKGNRPMASDFGVAVCDVSDGGFAVTGSSGGNVLLAKFDNNGDTINLGATDLSITVPGKMGIIAFGNAIDIASAGVTAVMSPRDVGATAIDLLITTLKNPSGTSFCTAGSYTFSPAPTVTAPSTTLSFDDCETGLVGDSTKLNGSLSMVVTGVSGSLITQTYTVQALLTSVGISAVETGGTLSSSITGGMRFQRTATGGNFSERSESIDSPATTLTFSESDGTTTRSRVLGPFIVRDVISASGAYYFGTVAGDTATVDPGIGPLIVTFPSTTTPVHGPGLGSAPVSGSFLVTAPSDNSRLTVTISNGAAEIAVDTDGNGTVDGTVSTTWDFLH